MELLEVARVKDMELQKKAEKVGARGENGK